MRAQTSHLVSPLANLCYKMLYRHDIFDSFIEHPDGQQAQVTSVPYSAFQTALVDSEPHPALSPIVIHSRYSNNRRLYCSQHQKLFFFGTENRPLPPQLLLWVKQLSYFLMHFPDVRGGIEPLRRLENSLTRGLRSLDR